VFYILKKLQCLSWPVHAPFDATSDESEPIDVNWSLISEYQFALNEAGINNNISTTTTTTTTTMMDQVDDLNNTNNSNNNGSTTPHSSTFDITNTIGGMSFFESIDTTTTTTTNNDFDSINTLTNQNSNTIESTNDPILADKDWIVVDPNQYSFSYEK
jgi:hypothetical protein